MPCPYESAVISDLGVELVTGTWFFTRKSVPHHISDVKSFLRYYVACLNGMPGRGGVLLIGPSLNDGRYISCSFWRGLLGFWQLVDCAWFVFWGVADRIIVLVLW
jgi:hypothetical protein